MFLREKMTSCACLVISGLNNIFQLKAHSDIFLTSSFNKSGDSVALYTVKNNEVSSANNSADDFANFQKDH